MNTQPIHLTFNIPGTGLSTRMFMRCCCCWLVTALSIHQNTVLWWFPIKF